MADYSADVVKADRRKCIPSPGVVNMKNAAVLHDVFQRIGALDIYFGLQKDLHTHEYPFHRRHDLSEHASQCEGAISLNRQDNEPIPTLLQNIRGSGGSNRSLQKKFTVDELYREKLNRLQSGHPDTGECSVNVAESITPSNAKLRSDIVNSNHNSRDQSAENTDGATSKAEINTCGSFWKDDTSNDKKLLSKGDSRRLTSSLNIHGSKALSGESMNAEVQPDKRDVHEHKRYGSNIAMQGTNVRDMDVPAYDGDVALYVGQYKEHEDAKLATAKSFDMNSLHKTKSGGNNCGTKEPSVKGEPSSPCSSTESKTLSHASPHTLGDKLKRLRIGIWFQRWFVPNLSTAISCVSKMAVDMGEELQTYFTPERLTTPNRKFEEVFLSSLEYAILKDDVTRSYFQIDNDHKEHLMMREVDDFRRMYQKRRINLEDFCHHFHPYLSRRKEDYTRNKQTESRDEDLQRRAIQQVLEKNIYGLSIEQPNEFFNKNCVLKPFQMLEPIP